MNTPPPLPPPIPLGARRGAFRWWFIPLGVLALLMLLPVAGLLCIGVRGTETFVTPGARVKPWHMERIGKIAGLATNETILFFYSGAVLDIESEGELLTDHAVYSWTTDGGTPQVHRAAFREISDIKVVDQGTSFFDDTMVMLTLTNDKFICLLLPVERRGDARFVEALRKSVKDARRTATQARE